MSHTPIAAAALDQLFNDARTFRGSAKAWLDKPVTDAQLQQIYDLAKLAPTSANCSPARIVFIRSAEAKEQLRGALDEGNVAQTMAAPVTALIGSDYAFYEHMDYLFPNTGARSWFEGKPEVIHNTAFRNASLQGGYLILAARALGLDCGPMSGFNNALADELFFAGTQVKSNFLVNIGYGNPEVLKPRNPRFTFDQACRIA
ncbi:malonic semialdehyde reductase [Tahibacter caeni]|uniref:malonic semialdehyde reductase n=1 Tax=Tahibacter caeni TaxID=1453545 RepID=UPI0021482D5C|nr:malonic semialdehyde reductase [Tahibacter caeni]